jgi:hypothetical protein
MFGLLDRRPQRMVGEKQSGIEQHATKRYVRFWPKADLTI